MDNNQYRWRKTGKAGTCWVCRKESTSVLVFGDNVDWFYVCDSHIRDPTFCTEIAQKQQQPAQPEQTQDIKTPSGANNEKDKDATKQSASLLDMFDKGLNFVKPASPPPSQASASTTQATPTGPRYFKLDSKILFLRERERRDKEQQKQKGKTNISALRDLEKIGVPKTQLS
ncbi:AAA-ATPase Vps4-associated protein 1-domain-containing protein [Obelidium mucronatum]|nr:AAA-ATPase Vps4-associated protein 1-domain-containing protein [Obelidium mucronatum]